MSTPTDPHNTGRQAPQGEDRPNPPALPGSGPQPTPPPVPTGTSTGTQLPDSWPQAMDAGVAFVALKVMAGDIRVRLDIMDQILAKAQK